MCIAPLQMPEGMHSHIAQQLHRLTPTIHICILQVMTWERPGNETMKLLSPVTMHALWHSLGHLLQRLPGVHRFSATDSCLASSLDINCMFHESTVRTLH